MRQYARVVQGSPRTPVLPKPKPRRRHRPVFRFWLWELIFLAVAVGCLVAIAVVIQRENGKPVEEWGFSITLNSLVALLSTILRGVMVAIAAEIIAQEKWAWLWSSSPSSRPLRTLHAFDHGTRGVWGALLLIPTAARRSPSTLLAITIIALSFAIGPFVQQSINTVGRDFTATGLQDDAMFHIKTPPSLPISHRISERANNTYFKAAAGLFALHPKIRADMTNALSGFDPNASAIVPSCETGNCTFPSAESLRDSDLPDTEATHVSLGLCSECFDLTVLAETTPGGDGAAFLRNSALKPWPGGSAYSLAITTEPGNLSWAASALDIDAHAPILRHSLANVTILSTSRGENTNTTLRAGSELVAATCALYLCMKTFHGSIQHGQFSERVLHTTPLIADAAGFDEALGPMDVRNPRAGSPGMGHGFNLTSIQSPCRVNETIFTYANMSSYSPPPEPANQSSLLPLPLNLTHRPSDSLISLQSAPPQCVYPVSSSVAHMLSNLYVDLFNSTCFFDNRQGTVIDCEDAWWLTSLWEEGDASFKTISDRFDDFADRVTNSFRTGTARAPGTQDQVFGMAHRTVSVTVVDWRWLLLPILLLAIEVVVLGWVVFRGWWNRERHGEMAWKSNVLPFVFYRDLLVVGSETGTGLGYGVRDGDGGGGLMTTTEMKKAAETISVRAFGRTKTLP